MTRFLRLILLHGIFCWALTQVPGTLEAQSPLRLQVRGTDLEWTDDPPTLSDSAEVLRYLAEWQAEQQAMAYWEASVDSLYRTGASALQAVVHRGPRYTWGQLRPPTNPEFLAWARQAGYRPQRFRPGRRFTPGQWTALRDSLVVGAADRGYPFAAVGLDSISWEAPGELSGVIAVQPGPLVRYGEVRPPAGLRVRTAFLERYLGIRPGEVYRESRVRRMGNYLAQLPYLTVKGPPTITFVDSLAFFDLAIERRAASRFDFVIGVLPNSGTDGRLLLTGDLNGELFNGFGQGERIAVRFEQLRPQTQELALALEYPFLFNLPFGFEGELDFYRRDSSFLNLNWRLAATYLREGNDRLAVFWENRRTIIPGGAALSSGELPDTLGVSRSFFGLQLRRVRTDRRFSPRNGYALDLNAAAGLRKLLDVAASDSLNLASNQLKLEGRFDAYFDPWAGTVLYFGLRGGGLFGDGEVLANEQYRLGGAKLLRGFDEQSVFARDYLLATAEFRLLLGGNAYLYSFVDAARLNPRSQAKPELAIDYPLGFGAGVNFETRAGVFALSLALGRRNGLPLDLGAPKVHLGYLSVF
ncbi:BamA/TamA family outer membrane protein [Neolewinella lacunae]|uniref:BamA/TamA family outer membrane protein n=1 Tax=Neolewinella lacunae TaxID=1517758 RepID=A0A923PGR3_9BACT|nr:BamA/TamA family outer membrane protein [Neolewinella lacunae]MBC6993818.1 BamA/TamA family outer membrane protein [Neolewinella lacunae]MDN3635291.1 BamA/TamA family outer membrane protein [Neolewinella lacunae]